MKKLLKPKLLVPMVVTLLLVGFVAYTFLAPDTMPKPLKVRIEPPSAEAAAEGEASHGAEEASAASGHGSEGAASEHAGEVPIPPVTAGRVRAMEPGWGIMYELEPKVVNLAEPGGLRYLQASIVLEVLPLVGDYYELEGEERALADEEFHGKIDAFRPIIDDLVMSILSSKTFNDISTIEGKQALKEQLTAALNKALGYDGILNIYFTEFVIQ